MKGVAQPSQKAIGPLPLFQARRFSVFASRFDPNPFLKLKVDIEESWCRDYSLRFIGIATFVVICVHCSHYVEVGLA